MKKAKPKSTQQFLPIQEIRDGIITLKTGGYRTVLMVNAINFDLKSADEQQALMDSYQAFLNGLPFPIQIVLQSRTLDLDAYLGALTKASNAQTNNLLRTQTNEYITFVKDLIGVANIMSKTFYVVIPHEETVLQAGFNLFGRRKPVTSGKKFDDIATILADKTGLVISGLSSLGLTTVQLNTQELIELLYTTYNLDTARRQKLFSVSNVDASVISNIKEMEEQ